MDIRNIILLAEMEKPKLTNSEEHRFKLFTKKFNLSEKEYQEFSKTLTALLNHFESSDGRLYSICDMFVDMGPTYRDYSILFMMGYFMAIFGQERLNKLEEL